MKLTPEEIRILDEKWAEEYEDIEMTDAEWDILRDSLILEAQLAKLASMTNEQLREEVGAMLSIYETQIQEFNEDMVIHFPPNNVMDQICALFTAREQKVAEEIKRHWEELLIEAVGLIKSWHNEGAEIKLGHEQAEEMWRIYYEHSPEMSRIREALGKPSGKGEE